MKIEDVRLGLYWVEWSSTTCIASVYGKYPFLILDYLFEPKKQTVIPGKDINLAELKWFSQTEPEKAGEVEEERHGPPAKCGWCHKLIKKPNLCNAYKHPGNPDYDFQTFCGDRCAGLYKVKYDKES